MTAGLLLAAGAGSRMGRPKALVHDADGSSWLRRGVATLREAGCEHVVVVLGAAADEARDLLGDERDRVRVVVADDWAAGMAASLSTGLCALTEPDGDVALVTLVDLPDVGADVGRRLLAVADGPTSLARATYDGRPGHPVLMGRDHWFPAAASVSGDEGARRYLHEHGCVPVECGDLATGADVDAPAEAPPTDDQHRPG
jgi:CTP:molybdopterin cytidylyltransferase MocA